MAITVNDNLQNNSPKALDAKYLKNGTTAYASVADVNSTILAAYRHKGLTVLVGNEEYWYKDGTADNQLVVKQVAASGAADSKFVNVGSDEISPIGDKTILFDNYSTGRAMRWKPTNHGTDYGVMGKASDFLAGWGEFNGVNPSGRPNVVATILGYNQNVGGGGVTLAGEPSFGFRAETHFELGPSIMFEFHMPEVTLGDGLTRRVWSMYCQKDGSVPAGWLSESNGIIFTRWDNSGIYWGEFKPKRLFISNDNNQNEIVDFIMTSGAMPVGREFTIRREPDYITNLGYLSAHVVDGSGGAALPDYVPKLNIADNVNIGLLESGRRRSLRVYGGITDLVSDIGFTPFKVQQRHPTDDRIAAFATGENDADIIYRVNKSSFSARTRIFVGNFDTLAQAESAAIEINSTTKGFLPPRMTGAQAEAISAAEGLMVYSTDGSGATITSKGWWGYNGTTWQKLN